MGGQWLDIPIVSISQLQVCKNDAVIVVCHSDIKVCEQIIDKLTEMGINQQSIDVFKFANTYNLIDFDSYQRNIFHVDVDLIESNRDKIEFVHEILSDDESKSTYSQIIDSLKKKTFTQISTYPISEQYFPIDLIRRNGSEIFVDVGAGPFGENIQNLKMIYGTDFRAYLFEPCFYIENFEKDIKVKCIRKALGDRVENVQLRNYFGKNAIVTDDGEEIAERILLDDAEIEDKITYLKIDVEGEEKKVISGSRSRIKNDRPIIACATYHFVQDFWEIPLMIKEIVKNYQFYLRSYLGVAETIFYAIPEERCIHGNM